MHQGLGPEHSVTLFPSCRDGVIDLQELKLLLQTTDHGFGSYTVVRY